MFLFHSTCFPTWVPATWVPATPACAHLFDSVENSIDPLEACSTVTESHLAPEIDWVQLEVSCAHSELVGHSEPLLGPYELPLAITQCFQDDTQSEITFAIAVCSHSTAIGKAMYTKRIKEKPLYKGHFSMHQPYIVAIFFF